MPKPLILRAKRPIPCRIPVISSRRRSISRRIPAIPRRIPAIPCRIPAVPCRIPAIPCRIPAIPCRIPAIPCRIPAIPCRIPVIPCRIPVISRRRRSPSDRQFGTFRRSPSRRSAATLTAKERTIHEQGLVSVLRQLHDDLDAAVAEAYGLPPAATDDTILAHLCALNTTRAAEERNGRVRWLRPEFQNKEDRPPATQHPEDRPPACLRIEASSLDLKGVEGWKPRAMDGLEGHPPSSGGTPDLRAKPAKQPWPKTLPDQAAAVRAALSTHATATDVAALARHFKAAKADRVQEILETLTSLGQARSVESGKFVGV